MSAMLVGAKVIRWPAGKVAAIGIAVFSAPQLASTSTDVAQGAVAAAHAHYRDLVGDHLIDLAPLPAGPVLPANLDEATALAAHNSPAIAQAQAGLAAARAASRGARAERLPSVGAFAKAERITTSSSPTIAPIRVQSAFALTGKSTKVAGSVVTSPKPTPKPGLPKPGLPKPGCAQRVSTAKLVAVATAEPAAASEQARASITHEVRIGMEPQRDLLDAEREAIAAAARSVEVNAARVTFAYRLAAALGGED